MKVLKKEKLFANSSYKKLFISSTAASFGDLFDMFAVMTLFTYVWHANSLWITLIPVAYALPSILLSQAAGNLADRYDKVQLMFLSELVRLLFTCLLFFTNEPLLALGVLTLRSMSSVMKVPAQLAYVREVVKEDQLLQASTLQNIMFQVAKVVGPFLGAAALTFTTPKACILVNAAACMISIGLLFSLKKAGENIQGQAARSSHQAKEAYSNGWELVFQHPILLRVVVLFHVSYFVVMLVDAQISIFLRDVLPHNPEMLGWLLSGIGIGALATGVYLNRKKHVHHPFRLLSLGLLLFGGALFFISCFNPAVMSRYFILIAAPIGGAGVGLNLLLFNYIVQAYSDKEHLGKVYGFINTLTSAVLLTAPLLGGMVVKLAGAQTTFLTAAIIIVSVGFVSMVMSLRDKQERNVQIDA
ncbi:MULTISPECIES: MFS transporter [Priestia]|uniref:MFS transporter n=1 Tax=Priestia TaxID=2800373 RepID=UPI0025A3EE04|nr:MFS transporter [Priestia aryabhattai]WJN43607.1 MFS transporter [Priestia aryabhattai]